MPAPLGPMMETIAAARHVERHILHGDDAAETLGYALDHKLIVALLRSHAPGRRPRHEPSLNSASSLLIIDVIMQAPVGERNVLSSRAQLGTC